MRSISKGRGEHSDEEGSHSGRVRSLGKRVTCQRVRGFESLTLRQLRNIMDDSLYHSVEQFIIDSFTKAGKEGSILHLTRTAYWLKQLQPDADEYMFIAALSHDIERAYRDHDTMERLLWEKGFRDPEFLRLHQEKGAEIIRDFLTGQNVDHHQIERVKAMVRHHEEGGNEEQNVIKDADSISFFENNISHFIQKQLPSFGKEKVKIKFDWMYNRITSEKAKQIAYPRYAESLHLLQSYEE